MGLRPHGGDGIAAERERADDVQLKGFKAYEIGPSVQPVQPNSRRDFYKICVLTGRSLVHRAHRTVELTGTNLIFANPHLPGAAQVVSAAPLTGYACLFPEEFVRAHDPAGLVRQSPLLAAGRTPVFTLLPTEGALVAGLFRRMLDEQGTGYQFKNELVFGYLKLLLYHATRLTTTGGLFELSKRECRNTSSFLNLSQRLGAG